jgi:hypothetical protein
VASGHASHCLARDGAPSVAGPAMAGGTGNHDETHDRDRRPRGTRSDAGDEGGEHGDIRAAMPRLVDQAGPASIPSRTWLTPGTSSQKGSTSHQLVAR